MELSISEIYRFRFTTIELLFKIITASGFSQANLREPIFEEAFGEMMVTLAGSNPITQQLCATVLSLPIHPYITEEEIGRVVKAVKEYSG